MIIFVVVPGVTSHYNLHLKWPDRELVLDLFDLDVYDARKYKLQEKMFQKTCDTWI